MFNKVRVGNIDNDVEKLLKPRFMHESDENYPKDIIHMYTENRPTIKINDVVLKGLGGELYKIEAHRISYKYSLATIQAA